MLNLISLDKEARRHMMADQMKEAFNEQHFSHFHESIFIVSRYTYPNVVTF
jgi:hypothetical protein